MRQRLRLVADGCGTRHLNAQKQTVQSDDHDSQPPTDDNEDEDEGGARSTGPGSPKQPYGGPPGSPAPFCSESSTELPAEEVAALLAPPSPLRLLAKGSCMRRQWHTMGKVTVQLCVGYDLAAPLCLEGSGHAFGQCKSHVLRNCTLGPAFL
jgi:hypothetical protein